jgi:hypothetical protein
VTTLEEARQQLGDALEEGTRCPVCDQHAQVYRRSIHAGMARALVLMYREHGTEWQDKTETLKGIGSAARDESLLRYWLLLEEHPGPREDGGRAGWWRVTSLGKAFVVAGLRVQKYALVYNGSCLGFEGDRVSIHHCLGKRFNLARLLEGTG